MIRLAAPLAALLLASACAAPQSAAAPVPAAPAVAPRSIDRGAEDAPGGMQWLYGSGEGAASALQTYRAMSALVAERVRNRPTDSVILANPAASTSGGFVPCGKKPLAIILDVDETAIQNLGLEYQLAMRGTSSDRELLNRWQAAPQSAARAMPGAAEMVASARALGVVPVFISNRDSPQSSIATAETLAMAGFPRPVPGETLLLRGDVDGKSGKDGRRAQAASRYCVIAMAGDTLGDFADSFNDKGLGPHQRRMLAERAGALWGNGWFLLSNPVYGAQLRGSIDEIFPPDARWDGK